MPGEDCVYLSMMEDNPEGDGSRCGSTSVVRYVIIGNHSDVWTFIVVDPNSWTTARFLVQLKKMY